MPAQADPAAVAPAEPSSTPPRAARPSACPCPSRRA